ncbi:FAD-binding protein [Alloalcanivorax xenomutans]|uniref:FAD-dependent oxidoreductase n=1 Tax=Alloalcanivorax xenomutans TaxID=1094342 RepID=UPI0007A74F78|nr:FAD-dependent oxidoreductase [Alloalcanivorax xenomutans]KYZ87443.1 fumarate reductase [Alcanivorax sp. KX64203]WOD27307.1 FAD-binding protein [Alloalcanivorax xenomutans]
MPTYSSEVAVIGAGLAGLSACLELLDHDIPVILLDGSREPRLGGQAHDAFGGMLLVDTPEQARQRIPDSPERLFDDWLRAARFGPGDHWGRAWAETYAHQCRGEVYDWLRRLGVRFVPSVQWVERGLYGDGNSLPRYHIAWGCGRGMVETLLHHLNKHPNRHRLTTVTGCRIKTLDMAAGRVVGCLGDAGATEIRVAAEHVLVCTGGIAGNPDKVRQYWDPALGPVPDNMLSGTHPDIDGALHEQVAALGGQVVNLQRMWNYAAGVGHPEPAWPGHGLSLIPPRSALWMDGHGRRIGPMPLVSGFDTRELCRWTGHLPYQYSWQVLNYRIAVKELAISGTDTNPDFRDRRIMKVLWNTLKGGDPSLVDWLIDHCPDVVTAETPEALAVRMDERVGEARVDVSGMVNDLLAWDAALGRHARWHNDDQLRRIRQLRDWTPDRLRTCRRQPILDRTAGPLVAIRERLISRKSMGGMLTDLHSRVLDRSGKVIPGLYAAGEAAGFGGGGICGVRSLEGTFLSSCILTGRRAVRGIAGGL